MINRDIYYRIHYLYKHESLSIDQISEELSLSKSTVRRHLKQGEFRERKGRNCNTKLDDFKEQVNELLKKHPYTAMQIFQMLTEDGFEGSYCTVKRYVLKVRPVQRKAYFKLNFLPGEAAQVDFGYCGKVPCENTERRLSVFVMVLCYSRYLFAEFIPCERQEHFLSGHRNAVRDFGGVPVRVIVDNCKCAVLKNRRYEDVIFNPMYLDFAAQYGFNPDACNPRSPYEKGIVENAVGFIKKNFVSGRKFGSLAEANTALRSWLDNVANVRIHSATGRTPLEMLKEERKKLGPLPLIEPDCAIIKHCRADKRCRVWFDANSYSVPSTCAQTAVNLKAFPAEILIYRNELCVARHRRCYGRKMDIVDPDHQHELRTVRKKINQQNLVHDFLNIGMAAEQFMAELELRELNAPRHMRIILTLVEKYGREAVAEAMQDMLHYKVFRAEYIEHRLMNAAQETPARGKLHVPKSGDLLDIKLKSPDLKIYNQ